MRVKIELVKSPIGQKPMHRRTVEALGLRRVHAVVEKEKSPQIAGMIRKVAHMVVVEEIG